MPVQIINDYSFLCDSARFSKKGDHFMIGQMVANKSSRHNIKRVFQFIQVGRSSVKELHFRWMLTAFLQPLKSKGNGIFRDIDSADTGIRIAFRKPQGEEPSAAPDIENRLRGLRQLIDGSESGFVASQQSADAG
jgi:hypothetical protein